MERELSALGTATTVSFFANMAEADLSALFSNLRVKDVTSSDELEKHIQSASYERSRLTAPGENQPMDIDQEGGPQNPGILYLYVDCPTMMQCFYGGHLPYNWMGGAFLTNLPPYQKDVSFSEVSRGLRKASGSFAYEDPVRSSYFAALSLPGHVAKMDGQMELTSTEGEPLTFDLYAADQRRLEPGALVRHGECKFGRN
ncbi:RolB family protein (plasmid) [Agrobacterium deltaense]|uniref:RolB family protein n=1 Tax=Agrobacterium deltaense TaxID=1183412 RepID=UPI003D98C7E5